MRLRLQLQSAGKDLSWVALRSWRIEKLTTGSLRNYHTTMRIGGADLKTCSWLRIYHKLEHLYIPDHRLRQATSCIPALFKVWTPKQILPYSKHLTLLWKVVHSDLRRMLICLRTFRRAYYPDVVFTVTMCRAVCDILRSFYGMNKSQWGMMWHYHDVT